MNERTSSILTLEGVSKQFIVKKNLFSPKTIIKAVDKVSFSVRKGETFGLIGESGSGKSTLAQLVVKLLTCDEGHIYYNGVDLNRLDQDQIRPYRQDIQIIFQHAQDTLDPKMTIGESIMEPLMLHKVVSEQCINLEIERLLELVGLSAKERDKYPFQLSGGQKQRVGILRAIASRPRLVVCDEPVSYLDVSVQSQILNLLLDLKDELKLTYLFISHDLKVVQYICDRMGVMYQGKIVEVGEPEKIFTNPLDSYTKVLVNSMK